MTKGAPSRAPVHRPCGAVHLPGWFESVMRECGASVYNHSAPCLNTSVRSSLSRHIGNDKPLRCVEAKNLPCPDMLARGEAPRWHVHSCNNVFLGYVEGGGEIYITCTTCTTEGALQKPNELVEYVKGSEKNRKYQWLCFDKAAWEGVHAALRGGMYA